VVSGTPWLADRNKAGWQASPVRYTDHEAAGSKGVSAGSKSVAKPCSPRRPMACAITPPARAGELLWPGVHFLMSVIFWDDRRSALPDLR